MEYIIAEAEQIKIRAVSRIMTLRNTLTKKHNRFHAGGTAEGAGRIPVTSQSHRCSDSVHAALDLLYNQAKNHNMDPSHFVSYEAFKV